MGYVIGHWMWFVFIGGGIGLMAGLIARERGLGIAGDIIIGLAGAMLGGWIAQVYGMYNSIDVSLITFIGAAVLVTLTRLIKRSV
jgi:uncharacterized membrane protein YeaQ/YmgE (transglycosylase-associated protein family)